jgi:hypothetical protein
VTGGLPIEKSRRGATEELHNTTDSSVMPTIAEAQRKVVYCECGAQLVGESDQLLFDVVQQHLAHHHPQLLGALEPGVVRQMAEAVGDSAPAGARG